MMNEFYVNAEGQVTQEQLAVHAPGVDAVPRPLTAEFSIHIDVGDCRALPPACTPCIM